MIPMSDSFATRRSARAAGKIAAVEPLPKPPFDDEAQQRRLDALRRARASNAMEGIAEHPDDAKVLEAFARGEIDGEAFDRHIRERIARVTDKGNAGQ